MREIRSRALQLAGALTRRGIKPGDRVATLAWNTHRHLECWYGIAGMGAVYHTLNPRLFPDQIAWIANHGGARALFYDNCFAPIVEADRAQAETCRIFRRAGRRDRAIKLKKKPLAYEDLIAGKGRATGRTLDEECRLRALLHLRHHRRAQGRALFPSQQCAAPP